MNKPAASTNRLKMHYCPIHQINIPSAQILPSEYTISSKVFSERVLLSNNTICDASVLLSEEQSGTVDMATWTEEAKTIRMVYSMVAP